MIYDTYSKQQLGEDLFQLLNDLNYRPEAVGKFVYWVRINYRNFEEGVFEILYDLMFMEEGPEFEIPKDELFKLANELINSKDQSNP
jgi:hypothetical protein